MATMLWSYQDDIMAAMFLGMVAIIDGIIIVVNPGTLVMPTCIWKALKQNIYDAKLLQHTFQPNF